MTVLLQKMDEQYFLRFGVASKDVGVDAHGSTPTSTMFGFIFQETSQCSLGHSSHSARNVGTQLQLPLMKTVTESLKMFFSKELVTAKCMNCQKENVHKLKKFSMLSHPKQQLLQLNRFSAEGVKNSSRIKIEETIEVCGHIYCLTSLVMHEGEEEGKGHCAVGCLMGRLCGLPSMTVRYV